jgi:tmRNA-binding protein
MKKAIIILIIIFFLCFLTWCFLKYILLENGVSLKYEEWNKGKLLAKRNEILSYIKYIKIIGLSSICLAVFWGIIKVFKISIDKK